MLMFEWNKTKLPHKLPKLMGQLRMIVKREKDIASGFFNLIVVVCFDAHGMCEPNAITRMHSIKNRYSFKNTYLNVHRIVRVYQQLLCYVDENISKHFLYLFWYWLWVLCLSFCCWIHGQHGMRYGWRATAAKKTKNEFKGNKLMCLDHSNTYIRTRCSLSLVIPNGCAFLFC